MTNKEKQEYINKINAVENIVHGKKYIKSRKRMDAYIQSCEVVPFSVMEHLPSL